MNGPEHCTPLGAKRLAKRLRQHWEELGYEGVEFWTEENGFHPQMRSAHVVVRSNLVGGLPRRMQSPNPRECYNHPMVRP